MVFCHRYDRLLLPSQVAAMVVSHIRRLGRVIDRSITKAEMRKRVESIMSALAQTGKNETVDMDMLVQTVSAMG